MTSKPQPIAVETPEQDQTGYEQKNVHEVYEVIATHFSDTRYKVYLFYSDPRSFPLLNNFKTIALASGGRLFKQHEDR